MSRSFELQGHRGARGLFAENTLEGFRVTAALGVHAIELDIAVTADAMPVVVHDPLLNPDLVRDTTGAWLTAPGPAINTLTLADLARFDIGRARPGSHPAAAHPAQQSFDGARIPTLAEVFAATATTAVVIDAELKTDPTHPTLTVSPETMAECVLAAATPSRLAIRSFDWRGLRHMRTHHPAIPLAWLTCAATENPTWWDGLSPAGRTPPEAVAEHAAGHPHATWAPLFKELTPDLIARAHTLGLRVIPWTVNNPADMDRLIAWGTDGFCTDRPDLGRAAMTRAGLTLPEPSPS